MDRKLVLVMLLVLAVATSVYCQVTINSGDEQVLGYSEFNRNRPIGLDNLRIELDSRTSIEELAEDVGDPDEDPE